MVNRFQVVCFVWPSPRYYDTMRQRNYVTPTSYLELIKTFKSLLNKKRLELLTLKDRYVVGLEKLEFSESQVSEKDWCFSKHLPEKIHLILLMTSLYLQGRIQKFWKGGA